MGLGLGIGVWWPYKTSIIPGLLKALCARATYCENKLCTTATLEEIAAVRYTPPPPPPPPGLLLEDYPGASVAYSLRNLIDTTTNVVRVRRSYDNTESNFTATEITDGTLVDFTNQGWFQSAINPFTTFTSNGVSGFDATDDAGFGETFVNVENGVSGDVVNITLDTSSLTGTWTIVLVDASGTVARSNAVLLTSGSNSVALTATGDFAFVDIFCQNPTTSISVTNFSASINVGDDGFVTTWYDQSGNSRDATQQSATRQSKLVLNGVINSQNGKPAINFNDDRYDFSTINTINDLSSIFAVAENNGDSNCKVIVADQTSSGDMQLRLTNTDLYSIRTNQAIITSMTAPVGVTNLITSLSDISSVDLKVNGITQTGTTPPASNNGINQIGYAVAGCYFIGNMQEIIIYTSDQTANQAGIETNINTEYTIY